MRLSLPRLAAAILVLTAALPSAHADAPPPPSKNLIDAAHFELFQPDAASAKLTLLNIGNTGTQGTAGTAGTKETAEPPSATSEIRNSQSHILPSLRIDIAKPATPFYNIQIGQLLASPIPAGHRLAFHFLARSPANNPIRAVIEKSTAPWTAAGDVTTTLTPDWKEYAATFTTRTASPPKGLAVRFQVGHQRGQVELAQISLIDEGPDPHLAAALAAIEPAAIAARIRQNRTATLTIHVVNAAGQPVSGAQVHIRQVRHAFLFGANIFNLQPANHEKWETDYQTRYLALLNYATLPFYWSSFEPVSGGPEYLRLDAMVRWCKDHDLTMKGHPLVWHEAYPAWAPATADKTVPLLDRRVHDIIHRYGADVHYFDVLNEVNNASDDKGHNGEADWVGRDGSATVVQTALGWARDAAQSFPHKPTLLYNDFNTTSQNIALLTELRKRNALPDAIGIQSHMHDGPWPLTAVWQAADDFAQFGRPIHFTEVTVLSGPARNDALENPTDWLTTPEGEAAQADYVAKFYSILFSHPAVQAITWWDFSDRNAWRNAPAGLVRKDMSPKPAYDRLMQLIHHDWWTDVYAKADASGTITKRAFCGEYEVLPLDAAGQVSRKVSLPKAGENVTLTITITPN